MTVRIFVEGATDGALLSRLLADLEPETPFEIVVANGRNAARPLARMQLVTRHEPAVLVVDADTTDEQRARSQWNDLSHYLAWGAGATAFKVVQFVPEIEVVFFDEPSVLRAIFGADVDPHVIAAGTQAPRRILRMLAPQLTDRQIVDGLGAAEIEQLRRHPTIADLRDFLAPQPRVKAGGIR